MVLVLYWNHVISSVFMLNWVFWWKIIEFCANFDVFGVGLILLDLHDFIYCSFHIEWFHIFLEAAILNLSIAEDVFYIQQK